MMVILEVAYFGIVCQTDFVMWTKHQTRSFTLEKVLERFNLSRASFLTGDVVVQAEDEQGVGIREYAFVEWEFESCLVDTLEHGYRVARSFADKFLERREGPEEQFQCSRDALLKLKWV